MLFRSALSPLEQNFFERSMAAQGATDPTKIPQRSPYDIVTDLEGSTSAGKRAWERARPFVRAGAGFLLGNALSDPYLGFLAASMGAAKGPAVRAAEDAATARNWLGGAPKDQIIVNPQAFSYPMRAQQVAAFPQALQRGQVLESFVRQLGSVGTQ